MGAIGGSLKILEKLKLLLSVSGVSQSFKLKAVDSLNHDVMLGIGFEMQMDVCFEDGLRRVQKNYWHNFATVVNQTADGDIFAEYTETSYLTEHQCDRVEIN